MRISIWLTLVAILAGTVGLSWVQAPKAVACSCAISTTAEHAEWAELVASGTVTDVTAPVNPTSSVDPLTFTVELDRVWKGSPAASVTVSTASSSASCGFDSLEKGTQLILFATHMDAIGQPIEGWGTNLCSGTGPIDQTVTDELTAFLGEPTQPPAPDPVPTAPVEQGGIGLLPPLALTAGAALLAGAWSYLRFRRVAA